MQTCRLSIAGVAPRGAVLGQARIRGIYGEQSSNREDFSRSPSASSISMIPRRLHTHY
jgi:hypothetical protein